MSRRDSMLESSWRVRVWQGDVLAREVQFRSETAAQAHYNTLKLHGLKTLECRAPGEQRFRVVQSEVQSATSADVKT